MRLAAALRAVRRELRGERGRFAAFALCLAVGVTAVTGVASLIGAVDAGVRAQSRRLLGADLAIEARRPLPPELDRVLAEHLGAAGYERTDLIELPTMAAAGGAEAPGASQLVELRAARGRYPLYGALVTEPAGLTPERLTADEVLVAPELLRRLGVAVGGEIRIGSDAYRVAGTILEEPDRVDFSFSLGPRVLLSRDGLERAGLLGFGSRFEHRSLVRLPGDPPRAEVEALVQRIRREVPDGVHLDVDTHFDAEPGLRRALGKVEWMLGLAALLSLVLGGVGVGEVMRGWVDERTRSLAILRCLGARPRQIAAVGLAHVVLLAAAGSALGALLGALVPFAVSAAAPDLVPGELISLQAWPVLRGFALGVGVALVFGVTPILAAWRVPPARVLRAEAAPLPTPLRLRLAATALLGLAVFAAAWNQAGRIEHAAIFSAGLGAFAVALAGAAAGLGAMARRLRARPRSHLPPAIRGGLAALGRPGAGSLASLASLGIGVAAVVALVVVERRLDDELRAAIPPDAPTVFLVDIQPQQWPGVERLLVEAEATNVESVPVIMARLAAVDGRPVAELVTERTGEANAEWVLTREQRLSWRERLPPSNEIAAGAWWKDDGQAEVSLEQRYAEQLRAGVGTRVRFDVQGVPVDFVVGSIRKVAWESFAINFFWITEPGLLEDAPRVRLASARIAVENESPFQDRLAEAFPNVTVVRVRPLLERLRNLFVRLALGVRTLGAFAAASAIAVVAGAVASATLRRRREVALLRALGATRTRAAARLAVEFAVAGAAAGLLGSGAGLALAAAFLELVVEIAPALPLLAVPIATSAAALLAAAAGLAASRFALAASPLEVFRR